MIQFFSKVDRNKLGKRSSETPAWAMHSHIENLRESIESKKRMIERGNCPLDAIPQTQAEIRKEEVRLQEILDGRPKSSPDVDDKLYKIYNSLGKEIQSTLFTRSDMKLGLASPHEEARRMTEPIIKVTKDIVELCKDNEVPVNVKGGEAFLTRNNATKVRQWIGKFLGEETNIEALRRDKVTHRTGGVRE